MASSRTVEEDAFDDACDLGQCCLDPCYFFYVKAKIFLERRKRRKEAALASSSVSEDDKQRKAVFIFALQQTAYVVLVGGCWVIVFLCSFPLIDACDRVSNWHKGGAVCLFLACVSSWLLAAFTPPGTITSKTAGRFDNYQCDGVLYQEQAVCPTMPHLRRPARSKFDRYSSQQVPRFDHFCGWLGQSIGEENYRFFLFFLVVHTFMLIYGTTLTFFVLKDAAEMRLLSVGDDSPPTFLALFESALKVGFWVVLKMVVMSLALPFLAALLVFHVMLIKRGMTTNEHFKWKAVAADGSEYVEVIRYNGQGLDLRPDESNQISVDSARQFYNLGFRRNIYEVLNPRSLRGSKKDL